MFSLIWCILPPGCHARASSRSLPSCRVPFALIVALHLRNVLVEWPYLFWFLKLVILTCSWTRFHCLSREAKCSNCCFDRYKSRTRSFRSSCVILCGSLPLVPEYVDSISYKDIDSAESSLEGISSSDEERWSLFTGGVGTGRSSEWGTDLIVDRRLGYLIFFLEDALKPVILVKQK